MNRRRRCIAARAAVADGFVNGLEFAQRRNPSVAEEVPLISVRASVASIAEGAGTASFTL